MQTNATGLSNPFVGRDCFCGGLRAECESRRRRSSHVDRLFFTSQGKTALVNADGRPAVLRFQSPARPRGNRGRVPRRASRHLSEHGAAARRAGAAVQQYYSQTPTHIWLHDLKTGSLEEICTKERLAPFETPALLVGDDRLLVQVVRNNVGQIFSMHLDGTDPREFTARARGCPMA